MSVKQALYCDKCGKKIGEIESSMTHQPLALCSDRVADGAGSMENEFVYADLCEDCKKAFIRFIFKQLDIRFPGEYLTKFLSPGSSNTR